MRDSATGEVKKMLRSEVQKLMGDGSLLGWGIKNLNKAWVTVIEDAKILKKTGKIPQRFEPLEPASEDDWKNLCTELLSYSPVKTIDAPFTSLVVCFSF